jgi:hypothetical protein
MARFFGSLMLVFVAAAAFADTTPTPSPQPSASPQPVTSARIEEIQKSIEQLSPEQQEKVLQNLHRWQALSPEERDYIRQQEHGRQREPAKAHGRQQHDRRPIEERILDTEAVTDPQRGPALGATPRHGEWASGRNGDDS